MIRMIRTRPQAAAVVRSHIVIRFPVVLLSQGGPALRAQVTGCINGLELTTMEALYVPIRGFPILQQMKMLVLTPRFLRRSKSR